jgi:hypothetical protein
MHVRIVIAAALAGFAILMTATTICARQAGAAAHGLLCDESGQWGQPGQVGWRDKRCQTLAAAGAGA